MRRRYQIADRCIEICSLYGDVHHLCQAYGTEGVPDFTVTVSPSDIEREHSHKDVENFSDGYLETLAVYRKIADRMLAYDTLLVHGSCIAVDGAAYLFTAKSGTGKSTHTRLWREVFGERAVMVNDDKPLIRLTEAGAVAYGTPWNGKHRLGGNIAVPLRAICILERAAENHIVSISRREAYPMLLQQTHRPQSPADMPKMLYLTSRLADAVKLYRLGCNMKPEAAKIAYEGMCI